MDANVDGEEIILDGDTDEPAADYKKEELLSLRSGTLPSDYVSKMKQSLQIKPRHDYHGCLYSGS